VTVLKMAAIIQRQQRKATYGMFGMNNLKHHGAKQKSSSAA